jgi:hypothetical protein
MNKKIAIELLKIASELTAGHSYAVDRMDVIVWGRKPFNRDTINAINGRIYIPIKDDDGEETDASFNLTNHTTAKGSLTYVDERKGMVRETLLALSIPKGYNKDVEAALQKTLKGWGFKVEEVKSGYVPQIRQESQKF